MTIGAGIAVAGIWLGVGIIGLKDGGSASFASMFAMLATVAVSMNH